MPEKTLVFLFADQLCHNLSAFDNFDKVHDVVLMVEVRGETDHVPHHRKKIAFLFSAMRHFSCELKERGIQVDYVYLEDKANTQTFSSELARAIKRHNPSKTVITEPGDYRVEQALSGKVDEIRPDRRFLCSRQDFQAWGQGRKQFRMENFYRWMRERTGILIEDGKPTGGKWNFDKDNRKPPKNDLIFPKPQQFKPDQITQDVLELIALEFPDRFGDLEPFWQATTATQARQSLDHFIAYALPKFGDYQDAMVAGEDYLFHSALSPYLNCGLLTPMEVIDAAILAYERNDAPINAVEGFIRQILGWREYVRGLYWLHMPEYADMNTLEATRPLPEFYWTAKTDMRCMAHAIDQTKREAHSHHIQRLMLTGNFALLIGVNPKELCDWYLAVYSDAFDWVELPNTLGMVAYADAGLMASKPYAASGAYINRMSDFCKECRYKVREKAGSDACPFNYLYWNFLLAHEDRLRPNRRMGPIMGNLNSMDQARRHQIRSDSQNFLNTIYEETKS